jgi:ABC-type uncharacterized transport system, periplasmic component
MLVLLRRLALGIFLIAAASALLLFSDLGSRPKKSSDDDSSGLAPRPAHRPRVALLQHSSQMVLDQLRQGMLDGMAERGWPADSFDFAYFNAEGDMPVAQTIAQRMASGGYDLLLSISTPSLQAVAAANREGRTPHIFAGVTLPSAAGVGISATDPLDHPAHLAGYGTMQPVARCFEIARQLNPSLKTVGTLYNAAEANAEAQMKLAREVCKKLGITLIETTVENSAGVSEATNAVISRGAEAVWVCGDTTVLSAVDTVVAACRKGRVPLFTVIPPNARKGGLFDVGANYTQVGHLVGHLAAEVLSGTKKTSEIAIENVVPETLVINLRALAGLRPGWSVPAQLRTAASVLIDENGVEHVAQPSPAPAAPTPRAAAPLLPPKKIGFAYYAPEPSWQDCADALLDELRLAGYVEGRNLTVLRAHASGEMVNILPTLQNFAHSDLDAIVTFSTPVLQGALSAVKNKPVVFTYCTDPVAAGAGRSHQDHDPRLTGIGTKLPIAATVEAIRSCFPKARRVGTLYNSGEINSVVSVGELRAALREAGIELVELSITTPGEAVQAVQALVARQVDLVYLPDDNTVYQAFDAISGTLSRARFPLVVSDPAYVEEGAGALFAVGTGYGPAGRAAARQLARVLQGESPAGIPFENVTEPAFLLNRKVADTLGLSFSPELVAKLGGAPAPAADRPANPSGKKWRISLVLYNETPPAEETLAGMKSGWAKSRLVAGRDYEIKLRSAQGDAATLGAIYDAALTDNADILVPISTPSLQAAIRRVKDRPIIFTMIANPIAAGAGKSFEDHLPNVTGIAVLAPIDEMLDLLARHFPRYRRFGTLFCPAEANSVDTKEALAAACKARGLTLETVAVNTATELPDAAASLAGRPIDAILQISDNLNNGGFTSIANAARRARKPLFSLNSATIPVGAPLAMGRDYFAAGEHTVAMVEQVIAGASTTRMPFLLPSTVKLTLSPANARAVGMEFPPALLQEGKVVD